MPDMRASPDSRCAIVFLMILTLGMSLGLPAEDVLETVYDESEALPYESLPFPASDLVEESFRAPQAPEPRVLLRRGNQAHAERRDRCPISDSLIILNHRIRC